MEAGRCVYEVVEEAPAFSAEDESEALQGLLQVLER